MTEHDSHHSEPTTLRERIVGLGTLVCLLVVGAAGHATHWSLPGAHAAHDEKHAHEEGPQPASGMKVKFDSPQSVGRSGVKTAAAEQRDVAEEVMANGVIGYDQRLVARLSTRVPGTVFRVEKHWGDVVHRGDVLALIESEDVGRLKAEFLNSMITVETKTQAVDMLEKVENAIMRRQLKEAQSAEREALVRLLNAEQALVNLGFKLTTKEYSELSDTERAQQIRFLGIPDSVKAKIDTSKATSNLVPVIAPFDGIVIGRDVGLGEVVSPTKAIFEIADVRKMWITLEVKKEDAKSIALGQEMLFMADGLEGTIKSQVSWVSTEVDEQTRTLEVRAEVDNPVLFETPDGPSQRMLRANTFGTGRITIKSPVQSTMVPKEALQWLEGNNLVFVQTDDQTFEGRIVQCGLKSNGWVAVSGDIAPGMTIAGQGSHVLKSQVVLAQQAN